MSGVLKIRGKGGNFISINTIKGDKGDSVYEYVGELGYDRTEEELGHVLMDLLNYRCSYYVSDDLNNEMIQGGHKVRICSYESRTLNSPYSEGASIFAHGVVITNSYTDIYGTQICIPSGDTNMYMRRSNKQGITKWSKVLTNNDVKIDLLWENLNPSVGFGTQLIALDLSAYNSIEVLCAGQISTNTIEHFSSSGLIPRRRWGKFYVKFSWDKIYQRSIECTDDGVSVGKVQTVEYTSTGYSATDDTTNKGIVPIAIYGIKGVR